jgi:TrmH family RNA methyltransferase
MYFKTGVSSTTEGVWLAKQNLKLSDLVLSDNPLILVAKRRKPGNIGALLRTADAANLDAVIIANPKK